MSPLTTQPAAAGVWELVPPEGEVIFTDEDKPAFHLSPELSQRCYGVAEGERQAVTLYLHGEFDPVTKGLRPLIEVYPAPTRAPLTLDLTFPTGENRTFVMAVPSSPRPATRSEWGEVLPPAAFGLKEGETGTEWAVGVETRRVPRGQHFLFPEQRQIPIGQVTSITIGQSPLITWYSAPLSSCCRCRSRAEKNREHRA